LGLALLLNQVKVLRAFFRSVYFLPTACSYVVASLVWKLSIFNGVRFGLANTVLSWFGVDNIAWLATTSPPWYWLVIVTVRLWLQIGFYMILFLAGLQRISPELYEAAAVDGARNAWQTFRYITFPQLRATSVAVLLLLLINAYQAFDEFFNLLGNSSFARPPLVYLYYTAQFNQDFGHGTAGAVILALLIMIVTLAQGRIFGFGRAE
jgi:multiple sugar transport system permease protein